MPLRRASPTRERLLRAAAELFAARGLHGTSVRDIAARASVNLAAANYHYGSKKALYVAVFRDQFAKVRAVLAQRGGSRSAAELAAMTPAQLTAVLRSRAAAMLDLLIGTPASLHATLMQRELCDPSEALPTIVDELLRPLEEELQEIVRHLGPTLSDKSVARCAYSIIAQALFYRFARPALLHSMRADSYPPQWPRELATHIVEFSLGGLRQLAGRRRRSRRAA